MTYMSQKHILEYISYNEIANKACLIINYDLQSPKSEGVWQSKCEFCGNFETKEKKI